jgi:hypothetical protein
MDVKRLTEAIARLAELDPAEVPDAADGIVDALAAELEAAEDPNPQPSV